MMIETKYIALDIYGTVLATNDPDNELPPRKGFYEFVEECKKNDIKIISASDACITHLKIDLRETGVPLNVFYDMIEFREWPKDFSKIIKKYNISPLELFVIGDNLEKDISGAKAIGARYHQVPEYREYGDKFNMYNSIKIH